MRSDKIASESSRPQHLAIGGLRHPKILWLAPVAVRQGEIRIISPMFLIRELWIVKIGSLILPVKSALVGTF